MKKVILATLAASIFSAPVLANPKIEFYGNMDAGIVGASNMGANKDTGTIFLNSPMRTSRLGFKGKEGISDGLTAGFQLEHQILPGDGSNGNSAGTSSTSNTLFNLAANLWIEDATLGKLTLGRQNSIAFEAAIQGDTRKGLNFGSMMTYWNEHSMFGGTSTKVTGQQSLNGGNQWSNAIRYTSPKWNIFTLAAQYGVGGVPGDLDANRKLAATVTYTGVKDLTLVVGQTLINDTTKEQEYQLRTERKTASTCDIELYEGYVAEGSLDLSLDIPIPGCVLKTGTGFKRQYSLENSTSKSFSEEVSWSVESVVKVCSHI